MKGQHVRIYSKMAGNMTGETECQFQISAKTADVSDKEDSSGWDQIEVVSKSVTFSASGVVKAPNNFLNWIYLSYDRSNVEEWGIQVGDYLLQGYFIITDFKISASVNDVVKISLTLQSASEIEFVDLNPEAQAENTSYSLRSSQPEDDEVTSPEDPSSEVMDASQESDTEAQ